MDIDQKLITQTIPETHMETKYVTQTVPVQHPVTTERTVVTGVQETKQIPVTKLEERIEHIPVKTVVPHTEYQTVTETHPVNPQTFNKDNFNMTSGNYTQSTTTHVGTTGMSTGIPTGMPSITHSGSTGHMSSDLHSAGMPSTGLGSNFNYAGVPDCKHCHGQGYIKSKLHSDKMKACKDCVKATGNCPRCGNTGYRINKPNKKCNCMYAK